MKFNFSKDIDCYNNENKESNKRKASVIKGIELKEKKQKQKNKKKSPKNSLQSHDCNSSLKEKYNSSNV
jgi:hypothetical protein